MTDLPVRLGNCCYTKMPKFCTRHAPGSPLHRSDETAGPTREVQRESRQGSRHRRHGPERQPPSQRSHKPQARQPQGEEAVRDVLSLHAWKPAGVRYQCRTSCHVLRHPYTQRRWARFLARFQPGEHGRWPTHIMHGYALHDRWDTTSAPVISFVRLAHLSGWQSKLQAPHLRNLPTHNARAAGQRAAWRAGAWVHYCRPANTHARRHAGTLAGARA